LLRLEIQLGENSDLDRAGLSEDFIFPQKGLLAGAEILNGHAHHAVETLIDIVNRGLEFLPEDRRFPAYRSGGRFCRRLTKSSGKKQGETDETSQG
jgi:hypothetical protein